MEKISVCINTFLLAYPSLVETLKFLITLSVSILAICIGGGRLKSLIDHYKKQRFDSAFGYHTILRVYCIRLKGLISKNPNFWNLDSSYEDTVEDISTENLEDIDYISNETQEFEDNEMIDPTIYRKEVICVSKQFLKFITEYQGQIPIKSDKNWLDILDELCGLLIDLSMMDILTLSPKKTRDVLNGHLCDLVNITTNEIEYATKNYYQCFGE
ncbi:MAG: hypothetical protein FWD71_23830 [Oscillospiraceae bacterium]|nr:hypothetical protein [Oscillospiraceae bacterium]